jgi:hypothetical protein
MYSCPAVVQTSLFRQVHRSGEEEEEEEVKF